MIIGRNSNGLGKGTNKKCHYIFGDKFWNISSWAGDITMVLKKKKKSPEYRRDSVTEICL
jgi:hypothetical protein